jgi:hypothetical protein
MNVAPVIREYPAWRVYLPARFVAEAFGYAVDWDAAAQSVLIGPPKTPVEPPKQEPNPQPVSGNIDMTAARNGTLQPPLGAVAPPDKWGFPAKALRAEFKVGERYAKVWRYTDEMADLDQKIKTKEKELFVKYLEWFWSDANLDRVGGLLPDDAPGRPRFQKWYQNNRDAEYDSLPARKQELTDGSKYQLDLGTEAVVVSDEEGIRDIKKMKPEIYNDSNCIILSGTVPYIALYVPFIPVAEAFGVPKENIVWDGEHLAVFGWDAVDGYRGGYLVYEAGKRESPAKWHNGEVTIGHLEFPLFVKDGVPMVGINSVDDFVVILCRKPGGYCAIVNIWQGGNGGWDYKTGIAATAGEL